jgi:hypothetical protein
LDDLALVLLADVEGRWLSELDRPLRFMAAIPFSIGIVADRWGFGKAGNGLLKPMLGSG